MLLFIELFQVEILEFQSPDWAVGLDDSNALMVCLAGAVGNLWKAKVSDERGSVQERWHYPGRMGETSKKEVSAGEILPSSLWPKQQKVGGGWNWGQVI